MRRNYDKAFFPYPIEDFKPENLYGNAAPIEPVYIAIPCIAYRVRIRSTIFEQNIFEHAIVSLKNLGLQQAEIAYRLCLKPALVNAVINNYNNRTNEGDESKETERTQEYYVFKDAIYNEYISGFAFPDYYKERTSFDLSTSKEGLLVLKNKLAGSKKIESYILPIPSSSKEIAFPSESEILKQSGITRTSEIKKRTGNVSIIQANCLGEGEPIYLICPCYITFYTRIDYDVMNPIRRSLSTDLKFLIEKVLDEEKKKCEREKKENPNRTVKPSPIKSELEYLRDEARRSSKVSISRRQMKAAGNLFLEFDRDAFNTALNPYRKHLFGHLLDAEDDYILAAAADQSRGKDFALNINNFTASCFLAIEDALTCAYIEAMRDDDLAYFEDTFPPEISSREEKSIIASCLQSCGLEQDAEMDQFVQHASLRAMRSAIEKVQNEEYEKLANKYYIGILVNAFLGSKSRHRVARFDSLGKNRPRLLSQLNYFAAKANAAAHGNAQDNEPVISLTSGQELRRLAFDIVHLLLNIKPGDKRPVTLGLQNIEAYTTDVALKVAQEQLGEPVPYGSSYSYLLEVVSDWQGKLKYIYTDVDSFYANLLESIVDKSGLSKQDLAAVKERIGRGGRDALFQANKLLGEAKGSNGARIDYPNIRRLSPNSYITTTWWLIITVVMLGTDMQNLERFLSDFPGIVKNVMDCKSERGHRQSAPPNSPVFTDSSIIKTLTSYAKAEASLPEGWYNETKE